MPLNYQILSVQLYTTTRQLAGRIAGIYHEEHEGHEE